MQMTRFSLFLMTLLAPMWAHADAFPGGGAALVSEATQWVSRETGYPEASITMSAPDRTVAVESCNKPLNFRFPFQGNLRTVEANCQSPQWKRFIRVKIEEGLRAVGTAKALDAGHVLTASDLEIIAIGSTKRKGFSDPEQLVGMTLKEAVTSNTVIEQSMVMSEIAIFVAARDYEAGEIIKPSDLIQLDTESPNADALTTWPLGIVTALEYIKSGQTLLKSSIERSEAVVVSATNIVRGQVIDQDLVEVQLRPRQQLGGETL